MALDGLGEGKLVIGIVVGTSEGTVVGLTDCVALGAIVSISDGAKVGMTEGTATLDRDGDAVGNG
jgi:hypothetical protein